MLDLLDKQAEGIDFLGHQTPGMRFLMLSADRPIPAVEETLRRMQLIDRIPCDHLDNKMGTEAAAAILTSIEDHEIPEIVFIEGGDHW
jgi:hypothetical protein